MIIWSGPGFDLSGYATAMRDYIDAFYKNDVDIRAHIHNYDHRSINRENLLGDTSILNEVTITTEQIEQNKEDYTNSVFVCHATFNAAYKTNARKNCLYTVWEVKYLPEVYAPHFEEFDIVLTASEFSKECLSKACDPGKIKILPHVIKRQHNGLVTSELIKSLLDKTYGKTIYLWNSEFHFGKGYSICLEGFCDEFEGRDDVILLFKTYSCSTNHYKNEVIEYIKSVKNGRKFPQIIPIIGDITRTEIIQLYNLADIFICTSMREAFGLCASEAFAQGCTVIAPDKGGQTEYLNNENSVLFKSEFGPVRNLESTRLLYENQVWVEPDLEDFKRALRESEGFILDHDEYGKVLNEFGEENITRKFLEYINE